MGPDRRWRPPLSGHHLHRSLIHNGSSSEGSSGRTEGSGGWGHRVGWGVPHWAYPRRHARRTLAWPDRRGGVGRTETQRKHTSLGRSTAAPRHRGHGGDAVARLLASPKGPRTAEDGRGRSRHRVATRALTAHAASSSAYLHMRPTKKVVSPRPFLRKIRVFMAVLCADKPLFHTYVHFNGGLSSVRGWGTHADREVLDSDWPAWPRGPDAGSRAGSR